MALLAVGDPAPEVSARTASGETISLHDLQGRWALVYFYPKDDTPGCTMEAKALNESLPDLHDAETEVIGVSSQGEASHDRFRAKCGLRFALAADTDRSIAEAYGVGKMMGILPVNARVSFLIAPDGTVAHVWPHVSPARHATEVLETVRRLREQRER